MSWQRLGRVFAAAEGPGWMVSHAANPVAAEVDGSRCRIFFNSRDRLKRSSVGSLTLCVDTLLVSDVSAGPELSFGETGAFDDSGVSLGCVVREGADRFLYYVGWNLGVTVPFRNSIGLAVSRDGAPFCRVSAAPVLDRSRVDPFSLSYPWVLKQGSTWKMWYGSTVRWRAEPGEQDHVIKYAESPDGIEWHPTGEVCIDCREPDSYAVSRPCVLCEQGRFRMWFSYRGSRYRIGYAESADGVHWERTDGARGLEPQGDGWESESVEYAHVFDCGDRRYALYCGNGYGATGFGLARWEGAEP